YGLVSGRLANALGDGHDFNYDSVNVLPVSTALVTRFGARDATGEPQNSVALTVYVPDAFRIDDRDQLGSRQTAFFVSRDERTIWAGVSYARRVGRIGVGAGGFLLIGTEATSLDITAVSPTAPTRFATLSARTDLFTLGVVGALGFRIDLTDHT